MGHLDIRALEQTLTEILRRHEVLRASFVTEGGRARQLINPAQPVKLDVIDISELAETEREARMRQLASEEAQRPFDLAVGPLLRTEASAPGRRRSRSLVYASSHHH